MEPALVAEGDAEDLGPEAVGGHHRVGLLRLGGLEPLEGVRPVPILEQGVLHRRTVDGAQQRPT